MISKEEFIERAEATMTAINKFNEIIDATETILGGCFENIYNTNIIKELINCLAATIGDKHDTIDWVITERKGSFPIRDVWLNCDPIYIEDWAGVYDLVQEEKRFDECVMNGGAV